MKIFETRNRKLLLIVFLPIICATVYPLHGYLNATLSIALNTKRYGIYPTLDDAVQHLEVQYDEDSSALSDFAITKRGDDQYSFIWYVMSIKKSTLRDGDPTNNSWSRRYYIHTKDGWIHYPETLSLVVRDLGYWMKVFKLYGGEL